MQLVASLLLVAGLASVADGAMLKSFGIVKLEVYNDEVLSFSPASMYNYSRDDEFDAEDDEDTSSNSRHRRAISPADLTTLVNVHNSLRISEGGSDMKMLRWNPLLATMAQNWSDACVYAHGQPAGVNTSSLPYAAIGQNLYATTGAFNATAAVLAWYAEKADFTYNTYTCAATKVCGHYTQVVWAPTYDIGCGETLCPTLTSSGLTNAHYLVCNYGPAGNSGSTPLINPYQKGPVCTKCDTGRFWCNNFLCDDTCTGPAPSCVCAATCQNCGTAFMSNCTCQCTVGWGGGDCSSSCVDSNALCNNGWYSNWCDSLHPYVLTGCPAMCNLCNAGTPPPCGTTTVVTTSYTTTSAATTTTTPPGTVTTTIGTAPTGMTVTGVAGGATTGTTAPIGGATGAPGGSTGAPGGSTGSGTNPYLAVIILLGVLVPITFITIGVIISGVGRTLCPPPVGLVRPHLTGQWPSQLPHLTAEHPINAKPPQDVFPPANMTTEGTQTTYRLPPRMPYYFARPVPAPGYYYASRFAPM